MAFNNRKVCSTTNNYKLDDIYEKINDESFFIRNENDNRLRNKIVILNTYEEENLRFIYGKFGFQMETEMTIPDIRETGIYDQDRNEIVSKVISFWISDNNLILFNSLGDKYSKKGKSILSNHLFDDEEYISEIEFDIDGITAAVIDGRLNNMWTSTFSGRHNNVQGGTLNGDNVNEDVMFNLTDESTKTGVGILYEIYGEEIKVRFYQSGTVQLLTTKLETNNPDMHNLLIDFEEYIIK